MSTKKSAGRDDRDDDRDEDRDDDRDHDRDHDGDNDRDHGRTIVGTNGNDRLTGTSGADTIQGRDGNDTIYGLAGNDNIDGGKGNDRIDGGAGNDRLNGGQGDDTLIGGAGNDYIDGGPQGHDVARYSGNYADYQITRSGGCGSDEGFVITVKDNRNGSKDGTDTLRRIESLEFTDRTIYLDGRNNAPVAGADTISGKEDVKLTIAVATLLANDRDPDGNQLTISSVGNATHGTVALQGTKVVFTPAANYNGPASFTYTVSDGRGGTSTATVTVNLAAVNDAPVAVGDSLTAVQNVALVVPKSQLLSNDGDVDGDTLSILSVGGASHGTVALSGGNVIFTPAANYSGPASFTYTVSDGHGGTSTATVAVSVTPGTVNHNPVAVADTVQGTEDTAITYTAAQLLGNDNDGDPELTQTLTIASVTSGTGGTAALVGGNVVFTPTANFNGAASFTYTVSDGQATSAPATVTVNVAAVNDAAMIGNPTVPAVTEDVSVVSGTLTAQGSIPIADVDSPVTFSTTVLPVGTPFGTLTLQANGNYTYTVANSAVQYLGAGTTAVDTFTVTSTDGTTKDVSFTIHGANDASVISGVSGPLNYSVGVDDFVAVAPNLTLADADSNLVTSAEVKISAGLSAGNDMLDFTAPSGIIGVYDPQTGVLQFSGDASLADYELALASVHFSTSTAGGRTISFTVFDHEIASITSITSITVNTSNISLDNLGTMGFRLPGEAAFDGSGFSVSAAGDVNGDGFADVIIGAPFANTTNGTLSGVTYVVFGKTSGFGTEVPLSSLGGLNGFRLAGVSAFDSAGFSVHGAGDVNGDGFSDLIIGAPYANTTNGTLSGVTYVVFGKASGFGAEVPLSSLDGSNGFRIIGEAEGNYAGYSVSGAGDVNGDGFADLIIGADRASPNGVDPSGAAYVVFGKATGFGPEVDLSNLDGSNGFRLTGAAAGDRAGQSVSAAGDVNGDGFGDLIIGAALADPDSVDHSGAAYVVFGKAGGFAPDPDLALSSLNGSTGFRLSGTGTSAQPAYSVSVSDAGDVNGDGFGDLIVGALYASTANGIATGAAYVVFGKATGFAPDVNVSAMNISDGFRIIGAKPGDMAGYSVSAAGDVNGDGYGDLIVGAPGARDNVNTAGTSYVMFGKASGFHDIDLATLGGNDGFRLSGVALGDDSGYSVSAAGDVNGDGFDDLIVGSSAASPGGMDRAGESYVIFGAKFIAVAHTYVGGVDGDTLQGTTANDTFIGGQGDDVMYGGGGVDAFRGGAGNDTIHLGRHGNSATAFLNIDGGSGFDTLALDGSGMRLDLTPPGADRVHNIERIDLTGSGNNTLVLDVRDLLNMSENSNTLQVGGNAGDAVEVKVDAGASWMQGGDQTISGVTYDIYILGVANLLIDQDLAVSFV